MKNAEWMIKNGNDLRDLDTIVICRVYIDITEASALKTAINSVYGLTSAKKTKLNM